MTITIQNIALSTNTYRTRIRWIMVCNAMVIFFFLLYQRLVIILVIFCYINMLAFTTKPFDVFIQTKCNFAVVKDMHYTIFDIIPNNPTFIGT